VDPPPPLQAERMELKKHAQKIQEDSSRIQRRWSSGAGSPGFHDSLELVFTSHSFVLEPFCVLCRAQNDKISSEGFTIGTHRHP